MEWLTNENFSNTERIDQSEEKNLHSQINPLYDIVDDSLQPVVVAIEPG